MEGLRRSRLLAFLSFLVQKKGVRELVGCVQLARYAWVKGFFLGVHEWCFSLLGQAWGSSSGMENVAKCQPIWMACEHIGNGVLKGCFGKGFRRLFFLMYITTHDLMKELNDIHIFLNKHSVILSYM